MRAVALGVEALFLQELRAGFRGRVHSVFERVVNIERDDGELFTLTGRALDHGPSAARLDLPALGACGLRAGDRVVASGRQIMVGEHLVVDLGGASAWHCTLASYPRDTALLRTHLAWLRAQAVEDAHGNAFEAAVRTLLRERADALARALLHDDLAAARAHASSMVGLGPGLTPSGDDFLVGLFAVLNIAGSPCEGRLGDGAELLAQADRSTHAISRAALRQAVAGRVRESLAALIEHLMHGPTAHLDAALQRVLAIGSSSGADMVAGIRCGLEINVSHEGGLPCP